MSRGNQENVRGVVVGGSVVAGQLFFEGRPQGGKIYGKTDDEVRAKAERWIAENRMVAGKDHYPGGLDLRLWNLGAKPMKANQITTTEAAKIYALLEAIKERDEHDAEYTKALAEYREAMNGSDVDRIGLAGACLDRAGVERNRLSGMVYERAMELRTLVSCLDCAEENEPRRSRRPQYWKELP